MKFEKQTHMMVQAHKDCNGDRKAMIELTTTWLKERQAPMKDNKFAELEAKGDKAFKDYARIKVYEFFTRQLPRIQAKQAKVEAPAPAPEQKQVVNG